MVIGLDYWPVQLPIHTQAADTSEGGRRVWSMVKVRGETRNSCVKLFTHVENARISSTTGARAADQIIALLAVTSSVTLRSSRPFILPFFLSNRPRPPSTPTDNGTSHLRCRLQLAACSCPRLFVLITRSVSVSQIKHASQLKDILNQTMKESTIINNSQDYFPMTYLIQGKSKMDL